MSKFNPQTSCHERLTQLGQLDAFVGRRDQSLVIDEEMGELEGILQRLEKDIGSRFLRLMEEVKADFAKHAKTIEETRTQLQAIFEQMALSPRNAATYKRTSHALDQQVNQLSRRMRPRMLRVLDKLSPKYKTVEKPLKELNNLRQHSAKSMVEYLWLLKSRNKSAVITPGVTLFELEFVPRLDEFCLKSRSSHFRYSFLRWRCKRRYAFYRLPFKEIVLDCLVTYSEINTTRLIQRHLTTHDELQKLLADAWRSIRYNMETTAAELDDICASLRAGQTENIDERTAELRNIVFDGLNKCLATFDDITVVYASFLNAIVAEISEDHKNALMVARTGFRDAGKSSTRLRWTLRSLKKDVYKWAGIIKHSSTQNLIGSKEVPAKLLVRANWFFTLLNLFKRKQATEESLLSLTDLPTEAELLEQSKSLPPIYRRLFQNEPLINREFLVGMEDEMTILAETYERWQSGRASSVAVIGPEGSGKTSIFNCFENELDEEVKLSRAELSHRLSTTTDVLRKIEEVLEIEEPSDSAGGLIGKIQQMDRQIVMLEHGHQLFLRTVGSRQALETFFYILMNTRTHVFWMLTFRLHPWNRMGYIHQIEHYFTHVIKSEFHNVAELTTALLLRQRTAGQEPMFMDTGIDSYRLRKMLTKNQLRDAPVQAMLSEQYFARLYKLSGGNMEAALYYWLRSLSIGENGQIQINPCVKVDTGFIKKLDSMNMLSLAEVLAHGGLTTKEHSEIFNVESLRSRLTLDYLRQTRLLKGHNNDKYGQPQYYTINPLFYQSINSVLSALHIIY